MSQVGNCIQKGYDWLTKCGINCTLEWTQGNHFREPDIRTAKAFAWVLTEKERMEQGIIYNPNVSELTDEQSIYMEKLWEFNQLRPSEQDKKQKYMKEVFAE